MVDDDSKVKQKSLTAITKELRSALNSLLPFVGLWPSLKLGCLRRIFQLHQPEELARYLTTVREIWSSILLDRDDLFAYLDHDSVRVLQLRNPSRYKADSVYMKIQVETGTILTRIQDESLRSAIVTRLLAVRVCIPSIETFLEDTKWLEPCSAVVQEHIVPKSSVSLFRSLSRSFICKDGHLVDRGERESFTFAYRNLFACAWRYFPELSGISPKQNQSGPKHLSSIHNDLVQYEFKKYAATPGFKLPKDVSDVSSPEKVMIRKFLSNVRPPDLYKVHQEIEEELINKIYGVIQDSYLRCDVLKPSTSQESTPDLRCGRPSFEVWNSARMFFKYKHLYGDGEKPDVFFADQRDIFMLFFGTDGVSAPEDAAEFAAFSLQPESVSQTNTLPRKRRRANSQEPRLAPDPNRFTRSYMVGEVFRNARKIGVATDNSSSFSHIIVFDVNKGELDIWARSEIVSSLRNYPLLSLCAERYQNSERGQGFGLCSISRGILRPKSLQNIDLLFMYKTKEQYADLFKGHRESHIKIWELILELSTKESSYMSSL